MLPNKTLLEIDEKKILAHGMCSILDNSILNTRTVQKASLFRIFVQRSRLCQCRCCVKNLLIFWGRQREVLSVSRYVCRQCTSSICSVLVNQAENHLLTYNSNSRCPIRLKFWHKSFLDSGQFSPE